MCFFKFFKCDGEKAKLHPCGFGMAIGLVKGLWMLGLSWIAWLSGYGMLMVEKISQYHPSYEASFVGGIYGGIGGFICGFIFGFFIAYFYNLFLCCCKSSCASKNADIK